MADPSAFDACRVRVDLASVHIDRSKRLSTALSAKTFTAQPANPHSLIPRPQTPLQIGPPLSLT